MLPFCTQHVWKAFPRMPFPETITLRIRGFPARKNSCKMWRQVSQSIAKLVGHLRFPFCHPILQFGDLFFDSRRASPALRTVLLHAVLVIPNLQHVILKLWAVDKNTNNENNKERQPRCVKRQTWKTELACSRKDLRKMLLPQGRSNL